jgi:hypothetical protein
MSQLNRNANYLHTIDGNTVWERLRVIRNFLNDRRLAVSVSELSLEKTKAKRAHYEANKETYSIDATYELREILLFEPQQKSNLADAERELAFLEELEKTLASEAETTRISGKTDEEMYEINYFEELIQIHLLEIKSQLLALGTLSPEMMRTLIKNKPTLDRAIEIGILDKGIQEKVGLTPRLLDTPQ